MSIATNYAHVYSAIQFSQNTDLYFELAKSSAWSDESNPDSESETTTDLDTSLCFKKSDQILIVYDGGTTTETSDTDDYIIYGGHKWVVSSQDNAYTNDAHYVLVTATISENSVDAFTYRQIGIRKGTTFASTVTGTIATPTNVTDKGKLWFYENKTARNHTNDSKTVLKYIINC